MSFRLSQAYVPTDYELHIKTDIKSKKFDGEVKITFKKNEADAKVAELHADASMEIKSVTQNGAEVKFERTNNRLNLLGEKLNESPVIIQYIGSLDRPNTGFYYINDTTACTQLESTHAREVLPCFDEPCIKTTFKFSLTAPAELKQFSNTPVESSEVNGEWKTCHFVKTPVMCSYLFAIAVGNFVTVEGATKRGLPVIIGATPNLRIFMDAALEECIKYVEWYEDFTHVNFPLPCLQVVAVPEFIMGAMENFGLILARESCSLGHPKLTPLVGFIRAMEVNCHEIAHQWAGDCVSPKWWDSIWLNEGFATIFPSIIFQDLHPEWDYWGNFFLTDNTYAYEVDQSMTTHPIQTTCNSEAEIEGSFDDVEYSKAGVFIKMLMYHLGRDRFRDCLRVYYNKFLYSNADTNDIQAVFSDVLKEDMKPFFDCWTRQAGFPLITLEDDGYLTQKRFTINGLKDGQKWIVPLFITVGRKDGKVEEVKIVMTEERMKLEIEGEYEWLKLNTNLRSFCRTLLKGHHQENLIKAIKAGKVSSYDMFSALNDMHACAKAGVVSYKEVVELLKAYEGTKEPLPLIECANVFTSIYHNFPAIHEKIIPFAHRFLESALKTVGMDNTGVTSLLAAKLRAQILTELAFNYRSEIAKEYGIKLYKEYMARGDYLLPEGFDMDVLLFVLKCGNLFVEGGRQYNIDAIIKSKNPDVSRSSIAAQTFVKDEEMDEMLLSILNAKRQNMHIMYRVACTAPTVGKHAWNFFKNNAQFFINLFATTSFILPSMVEAVMETAETSEELEEMIEWFNKNPIEICKPMVVKMADDLRQKFQTQAKFAAEVAAAIDSA
ncbi:Clan MA, family M1, aminopeptidase N-like metallopeptidase [Trichomonas vaginalis G3]|uniref:Aminopeptidase n=1 Tax=Trichomonas vaginalis (strain ATCC PRA-98 / G3) TaxID=412133 RepID=A2FGT3_TRIV3|nr:protease M1 zinc metalloprotease family [Trichomonas vaginalis G3]EAX95877.1 Clan MA, family M1, aminopeptidase N-like metallopeptidase [Trichomonas vaginalis G3]KAI5528796.1 protease M1 zinc metalloprotease family [Trichomonas vaginalis G3]|eukprot:XP_001308807.1 Clan MA, family M1, aminopeptidase N-like metallopeptidase [Trichomonas vaginalis G3]